MKLISRFAGTMAVAALAASTFVAPAHAAPGDAVLSYAPTAILNEGTCIDHAFTYAVELPAGTTDWTLSVELIGPDGESPDRQSLGTFLASAPSGADGLQLCSVFDEPGIYQIFKTVDYKVGTGNTVFGAKTLDGTFQVVRAAKSKVSLKAKRKGAKIVSTAKVSVSTGDAYGPVEAGPVVFQKKVGKKWKTVDQAVTDATGKAKGKFRSRGRTAIRAVFQGMGEVVVGSGLPVPTATSKIVRVR